jgi:hypothetical protein
MGGDNSLPQLSPKKIRRLDRVSQRETSPISELDTAARNTPTTIRQALASPLWESSMRDELDAHVRNGTCEYVPLPPGRKAIPTKWVWKAKHLKSGAVERLKSRWVAIGYRQKYGVDFTHTYAPTARTAAFKSLVSLASTHRLRLRHIDVEAAFVQGDIDEEIYVLPAPGYERFAEDGTPLVGRLRRPLYGLKQAPRQWNIKLHKVLTSLGFTRCVSDRGVYVYQRGLDRILLAEHVDDIVIASSSEAAERKMIADLATHLTIRDLGVLSFFLGFELTYCADGSIHLSQRKYALEILEKFGFADSNPAPTPCVPGSDFSKRQPGEPAPKLGASLFRSALGGIIYLCNTFPQLSFVTSALATAMSDPAQRHWVLLTRVLRYIKGNVASGILFRPSSSPTATVSSAKLYTDADWAAHRETRRSVSGYALFLDGNLISVGSQLQRSLTALSTCESEYVAAGYGAQELLWLRNLVSELGYPISSPTPLLIDNASALDSIVRPSRRSKLKHIDLRHHFIRDLFEEDIIAPTHVASRENTADVFTKALTTDKFEKCVAALGVVHCPMSPVSSLSSPPVPPARKVHFSL